MVPLSDMRYFKKWMNDLVTDQYGNNTPREDDPIELDDEPYVARRPSPPRPTTTANRKQKAESPLDASLRRTASLVDDFLGRNKTTSSQRQSMPPPSPRIPKNQSTTTSSPRTSSQQRHLTSSSSSASTSGVCASTHDYVPISLVHEPPPAVSSSQKRVRRVQRRREAGRRSRSRSRSPSRRLSPITDILVDGSEFEEKLRKQIERIRAIIDSHACDEHEGAGGGGRPSVSSVSNNNCASAALSSRVYDPLGSVNGSSSSSRMYDPFGQDDMFSCPPPQPHSNTSSKSSWRPHDPFDLRSSRTFQKLPIKSSSLPTYYTRPPAIHYEVQPQSEYIAPPPSEETSSRSNSSTRAILSKAISKHRIANNKKHFGWRTE